MLNIENLTFNFQDVVVMKNQKNINKSEKRKLDFDVSFCVVKFLEKLPRSIRDLFTPKTEDELFELESRIIKFAVRQRERDKVMDLQKEFNLPLRPNQSLKEVLIKIKILSLKKKLQSEWLDDFKKKNQDD